jgi:alpha-ribazole phosphatase
MTRLLLVRHGNTEFNNDRRFLGFSDAGLSSVGEKQVERLQEYLNGERIHAIYASDLKRTMRTADVLNSGHTIPVSSCPELREMNYGDCEGMTLDEIQERHPDVAKGCINFTPSLAFPGGDSFQEFAARTLSFLYKLEQHQQEETILIISHNGPLRVLICHFLGIGMEHWGKFRLDTASLSIIETRPRGAILNRLNDTSYLKNIVI